MSQTVAEPEAYRAAAAVTPSDSVDLPGGPCKGLYIGVAGNVTVNMDNGGAGILFTAAPVGVLPIVAKRVLATGTAATGIVALY